MIGAGNFRSSILVYERTNSNTSGVGNEPTFALASTWKGQVIEISTRARMTYGALSGEVTHEVKVRGGAPEFTMGSTEFQVGTLRLKPLAPPRRPGGALRPITLIPCKDVTKKRGQQ